MFEYGYKIILVLGMLALPFLIVSLRNPFSSGWHTAMRFLAAVLTVWGYVVITRLVVSVVDPLLATSPERLEDIYSGDGAKNVFALFFGWVPGVVLAIVAWGTARLWWWLKRRKSAGTAA